MSTVTCPSCGTKSAAGKKFCGECGAALPLVCPACGHPVMGKQKFCDECGAPLRGPAPAQQVSPLVTGAPQEERRLVTAVFCDLVGFTPLSERLDPEEVREVQAAYFSAMNSQIERYGGIVEKYAGDAVLALFGVPVAHEDDPERAVLCALGMQQAIQPLGDTVRRRYRVELAIRVGVNTGEAVSGSWDASGQQQAAITGDAINVAARMQAAAEPGGVLVGAETMRLARRRVRFGERQELTLKGKAEPVAAYAALGLKEQLQERWEAGERTEYATPLVGRGQELEMILTTWQRTQAGEGQLLTVIGEPGVGKSRVVAEGIARIRAEETRPHWLLRGRCLSYGQRVSLWLIADLLRSLCSVPENAGLEAVRERITATVEEVLAACDETDRGIACDVLGEVIGLSPSESVVAQEGPQIRRGSLIRTLGLVLGSLSETGPLLVVLEDLHWLDAASGEILEALLTEVPGRRILVLATQRPGWTAPWSGWGWTERLVLRPLPDDEAAALAGAVLGGGRLSPQLEEHLRERAEGNPFFVEELVRYLQDTGGVERREREVRLRPGVAERLPATLTEVLLARLDRLESQAKAVAQVGSVIGRSFAVQLLSRVMEREEATLAAPLRALQQAEIAFPRGGGDPEYIFKHVTVRDAAYGMLVQRRRRQLHLAAGRAIAQLYPSDEYVEMIAYHYARTEEDAEAAEWLEKAGDRAGDAYANGTAVQHYRAALKRLERCGGEALTQARIEFELGRMLDRVERFGEAEEVLERALQRYEEAGYLERAGWVTCELGYALTNQGKLEEARERLEAMAARLAECGPSMAAIGVQYQLSEVFQWQGRYGEMLATAERMVELAREAGDDLWRGRAQENRGAALNYLGRIEEAREALEEAIQLVEATGRLTALVQSVAWLGENRRVVGALAEARRLNQQALELATRTGLVRDEMFCHLNLAQLLATTGEWARAREHLTRAEEIGQAHGTAAWVAPWLPLNLGTLVLRQGDLEQARELLNRTVELAEGTNPEVLGEALALLADLEILEGRAEEARHRVTHWVDQEGVNLPLQLPVLAWAELELGETERGLELAERAERDAREREMLLYLPEALRIKGMALSRLGRHPEGTREARKVLMEGRERAAAMPNPYTEARILVELGLLDRQERNGERAREHLGEAHAIFRRLGAQKDTERAEQALAALDRSPDLAR